MEGWSARWQIRIVDIALGGERYMTQLQCDIPEETATRLLQKANQMNLSVSKYLAQLIEQDLKVGWPEGYFDLFGSCQDAPLERLTQGENQSRETLL